MGYPKESGSVVVVLRRRRIEERVGGEGQWGKSEQITFIATNTILFITFFKLCGLNEKIGQL